jgi:hypothetical protein
MVLGRRGLIFQIERLDRDFDQSSGFRIHGHSPRIPTGKAEAVLVIH